MTADEFWDDWSYISCKDCEFYHFKCKRIDHHHFTFARPWFQSKHYSYGSPEFAEIFSQDRHIRGYIIIG